MLFLGSNFLSEISVLGSEFLQLPMEGDVKHSARRPTPGAQLNKTLTAWGPAQEMH